MIINKTTVTDYLANYKQKAADNNLFSDPAILFTNDSDKKYGSIFLFERFGHAENDTYRISSQITDHYMEDNETRQDHWAIAPDVYILSGFIGEVIYTPPKQWQTFTEENFVNYLAPLSMISPAFDSYTQAALNAVQAVEASYRRYEQIARNIYEDLTNTGTKRTNQRYIMQILKNIQLSRQLVSIWTPFRTFENMAIQNVSINQGGTKYKSRLEIEFKQWRPISSNNAREATEEEKKSYVAATQKMREQDAGEAATEEKKISTLKREGAQILLKP